MRILRNPQHPVQLVIAGKAHPQDGAGQDMIRQWSEFIRGPGTHSLGRLSQRLRYAADGATGGGVDVWINTPRRPWEASGTSGMKVLVNGGLNLSELDGWWAEAYAPEVGWAIGDGREHGDDPAWDAAEAEALYALLEQQIVPEFYERDERGDSREMGGAHSREHGAPDAGSFPPIARFAQYTENHYFPAAAAYAARAERKGKLGLAIAGWQQKVAAGWSGVAFGPLKVEPKDAGHRFEVVVYQGQLEPDGDSVELFATGQNGDPPFRMPMDRGNKLGDGGFIYSATVADGRNPASLRHELRPVIKGLQFRWKRLRFSGRSKTRMLPRTSQMAYHK